MCTGVPKSHWKIGYYARQTMGLGNPMCLGITGVPPSVREGDLKAAFGEACKAVSLDLQDTGLVLFTTAREAESWQGRRVEVQGKWIEVVPNPEVMDKYMWATDGDLVRRNNRFRQGIRSEEDDEQEENIPYTRKHAARSSRNRSRSPRNGDKSSRNTSRSPKNGETSSRNRSRSPKDRARSSRNRSRSSKDGARSSRNRSRSSRNVKNRRTYKDT